MQSIMFVIINMNESKLKRKGLPKLLSDLEEKKSRSGSQGKAPVKEISSRSIPMQDMKYVLINVTKTNLNTKVNQNY